MTGRILIALILGGLPALVLATRPLQRLAVRAWEALWECRVWAQIRRPGRRVA